MASQPGNTLPFQVLTELSFLRASAPQLTWQTIWPLRVRQNWGFSKGDWQPSLHKSSSRKENPILYDCCWHRYHPVMTASEVCCSHRTRLSWKVWGRGVGCHGKRGSHCTESVYVGEVITQSLCRGTVIIKKKTSPDSYFQVLEFH